ncbi:hypothetical protein PR048_003677 [Dryococelus australis]|uniref:Uncharacterized protein n=1 Tax=Dryococelus australis TaxID=614101 RepID=A0ABQ9INR4_9NEOP|nr:hypothetical protein PR048_003677 [Dryococelus australis]
MCWKSLSKSQNSVRSGELMWVELSMEQRWNEEVVNMRSSRKLANQRHRPAQFPLVKICSEPAGIEPSMVEEGCPGGKLLTAPFQHIAVSYNLPPDETAIMQQHEKCFVLCVCVCVRGCARVPGQLPTSILLGRRMHMVVFKHHCMDLVEALFQKKGGREMLPCCEIIYGKRKECERESEMPLQPHCGLLWQTVQGPFH